MEAAQTPATPTPAEPPEAGAEAHSAPQADQGNGQAPVETGTDAGAGQSDERDEATGQFLSREAATYRRRLRETETERDTLRERVEELQRAEVERLAYAAGMLVPGDLWTLGTQLDNMRDDDGRIDSEGVNAVVADVLRAHPHWRGRWANGGIGQGDTAAGRRRKPVGLSQLLKP